MFNKSFPFFPYQKNDDDGPDHYTRLNKSWKLRNDGPYQCQLQQYFALNPSAFKKQIHETACSASDYELKTLWT